MRPKKKKKKKENPISFHTKKEGMPFDTDIFGKSPQKPASYCILS